MEIDGIKESEDNEIDDSTPIDPLSLFGLSERIEIIIEDDEPQAGAQVNTSSGLDNIQIVDVRSLNQTPGHSPSQAGVCAVPSCKGKSVEYLFPVPTNFKKLQLWDLCIGNSERFLRQGDSVCRRHFQDFDILVKGVPQLHDHALPCIQYHKTCAIPRCTNKDVHIRLPLPILNRKALDDWINVLKYERLGYLPILELARYWLCKSHFPSDCIDKNGNLQDGTIPTLMLTSHLNPPPDFPATHKRICAFKNCENHKNGTVMLRFPKTEARLMKWIEACKNSSLKGPTLEATLARIDILHYGICKEHYKSIEKKSSLAFSRAKDNKIAVFPKSATALKKVKLCFYRGCQYIISKSNPLYTFPVEKKRYDEWMKACGKHGTKDVCGTPQVCSRHFKPSMINSDGSIAPNAVPLPYNPNEEIECEEIPDIADTPETSSDTANASNKLKKVKLCFYRGCQYIVSKSNPLYSFPTHKKRYDVWMKACGKHGTKEVCGTPKVCSRHFKPSMINSDSSIAANAVPMPYDPDEEIEYEEMQDIAITSDNSDDTANASNKAEISVYRCAVKNCNYDIKNTVVMTHRFPDPAKEPDRFDIWVNRCGSNAIKDLSRKSIYEKYIICERHFDRSFYEGPDKLSSKAVPTFAIPETSGSVEVIVLDQPVATENRETSRILRDRGTLKRPHVQEEKRKPSSILEGRLTVLEDRLAKQTKNDNSKAPSVVEEIATKYLQLKNENIKSPRVAEEKLTKYLRLKKELQKKNEDVSTIEDATENNISNSIELKDLEQPIAMENRKATCILGEDRLIFPGAGKYLHMRNVKRKFPYDVYKYKKYTLARDIVEAGESINIHTAIIIDDDDEFEKRILEQLK